MADVDPEMRIRFTSPHPKDFPDEVLRVIAERPNVCACLHMPAQSGNNAVLDLMGNLIDNAISFSPENGEVTIGASLTEFCVTPVPRFLT